jgi:glycine/D-amino acid oxidase-like deaminating enzyme
MPIRRVAVIGAGIVGAAVARAFASAGVAVTVAEAARPGSGTSAASLAWVNANRKPPRGYHDFSVRAMREWRTLAADVGRPDWYVPTGSVTWAGTDVERAELDARVVRLRDWGYPADTITTADLRHLEPHLRVPDGARVAYFPGEAFVHTDRAVDALLADARARGADLVAGVGAAVLESTGTRVAALRLPDGRRIRADAYVCCAGWRTPHLLAPLGVRVPLVPGDAADSTAPGLVARIAAPRTLLGRVAHAPDLSLRPARAGGLRVDADDINRRVHAGTPPADIDRYGRELAARARRILAGLPADAPVRTDLCIRPLPVDGLPVVGWLPAAGNAYVVVCHSGVTLAPLLARLVRADVTDGPQAALDPYRIDRFRL